MKLLEEAKAEIQWPFGLRSLLRQRPSWVLLPSARLMLGCRCELCHNLELQIRYEWQHQQRCINLFIYFRALNSFILKAKRGSALEKLAVSNISTISSVSTLITLLLHQIVSTYAVIQNMQILPSSVPARTAFKKSCHRKDWPLLLCFKSQYIFL